jgi:hypothetical protein
MSGISAGAPAPTARGQQPAAKHSMTSPEMRPVASPAAFKSEPKKNRASRDGAATSPTVVKTSSPDAARTQSVAEGASRGFIGGLLL